MLYLLSQDQSVEPTEELMVAELGPHQFEPGLAEKKPRIGVVHGLCWTPSGGDILVIEALAVPGQGKLVLTGNLGDVMKESSTAALSLILKFE